MSKKYINTLDFYGYGESNKMEPALGSSYKVKVSDKDGNIITIEKDGSLYACVKLAFDTNTGILSLLDAAHNDSVLAEVEMPNADYIYNCRFDEELNAILFDVKSLYGDNTDTIELDVESLVELYEAGQGIEIGEKNEETGRKPISVKLVEGEDLLTLTDDGLGIDDSVVTEDELYAAISGKADISYVNELFYGISGITSGITDILEEHETEIEKLKRIVGTEEEIPSLFEQIESNREDISELDGEIGDISGAVNTISEKVDSIENNIDSLNDTVNSLSDDVDDLREAIEKEVERATSAETDLRISVEVEEGRAISAETVLTERITGEENARKESSVSDVVYNSSAKTINFFNENGNIITSIDTTDFIKDGMVKSVAIETVDDTTYLVITWNTDAGIEETRINLGDLFDADDYYTKAEIDSKIDELHSTDDELAQANERQWSAITQNREEINDVDQNIRYLISQEAESRENEDNNLWEALRTETNERTTSDASLQAQINAEAEERRAKDTQLENAIADERRERISDITDTRNQVISGITNLQIQLTAEVQRAQGEEGRIDAKYDGAITDLRNADIIINQHIDDQDAIINRRIDGVVSDLEVEQNTRQTADLEMSNDINYIRRNYATVEYVDNQDDNFKEAAIQTSTGYAKSYTDTEVDRLEVALKRYCDSGHTELQHEISDNATKINAISSLRGVTGSNISNYDDSGNGILDVLHREFHYHITHDGSIKEIYYEDGNIIIIYETPYGEKSATIPVSTVVDLRDYYKKNEVDALLDNKANVTDLNGEIQRATEAERLLNEKIDNLDIDGGIY